MHRSGTSALTRVLQLMGCYGGPADSFQPADVANPAGYWERRDLHGVNERLLDGAGGSWYDVTDLDLRSLGADLRRELGDEARRIVLEMEEHAPGVLKDPRLCVLMRFWRPLVSDPVIVLVYRHPSEVAQSLLRRDGFPIPFGLALWEKYTRAALEDTVGLRRALVSYQDLVEAPIPTAHKLLDDLRAGGVFGLRPPSPAVLEFIDSGLRHHRAEADGARFLRSRQRQLYRSLADGSALAVELPEVPERTLEILHACGRLRRYEQDRWQDLYKAWQDERRELLAQRNEAIRQASSLRRELDAREADRSPPAATEGGETA